MSQLKLTAASGGGTVAIKGPSSTTGNAAIELTLPGTANGTLAVGNTGKILKVVQVVKKDVQSHTGTSFVDVSGFNPSITPTATGSKILLDISINGTGYGQGALDLYRSIGGGTYTQLTDFIGDSGSNVYRTTISFGGQDSTSRENVGLRILDTPSYSSGQAIAYKLKMGSPHNSGYYVAINRVQYIYNGSNYDKNCISTFTLSEVAA